MVGRRADKSAPASGPIVRMERVFDVSVTTRGGHVASRAEVLAVRDSHCPPAAGDGTRGDTEVPGPVVVRAVHPRPHVWTSDRRLRAVTRSTDGPFCRFPQTGR